MNADKGRQACRLLTQALKSIIPKDRKFICIVYPEMPSFENDTIMVTNATDMAEVTAQLLLAAKQTVDDD